MGNMDKMFTYEHAANAVRGANGQKTSKNKISKIQKRHENEMLKTTSGHKIIKDEDLRYMDLRSSAPDQGTMTGVFDDAMCS